MRDTIKPMLSAIIPSWKDPHLNKTMQSILDNSRGDIEIIPVIDGYELKEPLIEDPRIKPIFKENAGMREAINSGVAKAEGEYLMRTDEHCVFAPAFDTTILETIEDNWIVTPRRYKLDVDKWEVMDEPPIDFEKLVVEKFHNKFHGVPWRTRDEQLKDVPIAPTMAMQGSCWFMPHSWWDKTIGRLDSTGYHTHYQDSIEMVFKTWKAGGELMLNKNTWYAHKHRKFSRTHSYPNELARESWDYAIKIHSDYYQNEVIPKWFK